MVRNSTRIPSERRRMRRRGRGELGLTTSKTLTHVQVKPNQRKNIANTRQEYNNNCFCLSRPFNLIGHHRKMRGEGDGRGELNLLRIGVKKEPTTKERDDEKHFALFV